MRDSPHNKLSAYEVISIILQALGAIAAIIAAIKN